MNVLAVIPCKGRSRRLPGKNLRQLAGKPLVTWTLDAAMQAESITHIVLAADRLTADSGIEVPDETKPLWLYIRPDELSADNVPAVDVVVWTLEQQRVVDLDPDLVVMLQATSPFRTAKHIDEAVGQFQRVPVISVSGLHGEVYGRKAMGNDALMAHWTAPHGWYVSNGAIYVAHPGDLMALNKFHSAIARPYRMDEVSSIQIDTELDWLLAESVLKVGLV